MSVVVVGIDPGPDSTATVVWNPLAGKIVSADWLENERIESHLARVLLGNFATAGIEGTVCYGTAVGKSTFTTEFWAGRISVFLEKLSVPWSRPSNPDIRLHFCGTKKSKDSHLHQAIMDRYGGKGTKEAPGPLYGLSGEHNWSALSVALYVLETSVPGKEAL